ncbi:(RS)-norcoclaurine 6-O-methyltransferase-like [Aristolochia californica]|uniref:(RS)-norcoclaurine 6-O-methyltransferase-like n=1 Tax=Aristolochia californica TaxID=171875 RepID=UPI0035E2D262
MADCAAAIEIEQDTKAQAKIWKLTHGFVDAMVLRAAVELGVADVIHHHGGPVSLSYLSTRLPLNSVDVNRLYRMMRYLVHLGVFTQESAAEGEEPRYGLGNLAEKYLVRASEECLAPLVLAFTEENSMKMWHYVKDALVPEGPSPSERAFGMTVWEDYASNPEKSRQFNEAMACDARILTSSFVRECGDMLAGIGSIVDVGGGTGATMQAVAKAFPQIKCTVFDLPHVIEASSQLPDIANVKGDMFESVPAADAVLLKSVLHDWGDEDCVKILKRCREAVAGKGGKVIIIEYVLDDSHSDMKLLVDTIMLVGPGGKERTEAEWKKLIRDAGYAGYKIKRISALQSVIEAYP